MQANTGPYSLTGQRRPFIADGSDAGRMAESEFLLSFAETNRSRTRNPTPTSANFIQNQRQNSVAGTSSASPPVLTHTQNVINTGTATSQVGESTSEQPDQPIRKVDHTMESTSDMHSSSSSPPTSSPSTVSSARLPSATTHGCQSLLSSSVPHPSSISSSHINTTQPKPLTYVLTLSTPPSALPPRHAHAHLPHELDTKLPHTRAHAYYYQVLNPSSQPCTYCLRNDPDITNCDAGISDCVLRRTKNYFLDLWLCVAGVSKICFTLNNPLRPVSQTASDGIAAVCSKCKEHKPAPTQMVRLFMHSKNRYVLVDEAAVSKEGIGPMHMLGEFDLTRYKLSSHTDPGNCEDEWTLIQGSTKSESKEVNQTGPVGPAKETTAISLFKSSTDAPLKNTHTHMPTLASDRPLTHQSKSSPCPACAKKGYKMCKASFLYCKQVAQGVYSDHTVCLNCRLQQQTCTGTKSACDFFNAAPSLHRFSHSSSPLLPSPTPKHSSNPPIPPSQRQYVVISDSDDSGGEKTDLDQSVDESEEEAAEIEDSDEENKQYNKMASKRVEKSDIDHPYTSYNAWENLRRSLYPLKTHPHFYSPHFGLLTRAERECEYIRFLTVCDADKILYPASLWQWWRSQLQSVGLPSALNRRQRVRSMSVPIPTLFVDKADLLQGKSSTNLRLRPSSATFKGVPKFLLVSSNDSPLPQQKEIVDTALRAKVDVESRAPKETSTNQNK